MNYTDKQRDLTKRYGFDTPTCVHGHPLSLNRDSYGGCRECRLQYVHNWRAERPGYTARWNRKDRAKVGGGRFSSYDELIASHNQNAGGGE